MSKKIILFLVCFNFIVFGCSYEPVLLQKKIDFTVGQFISSGEKNINLKIQDVIRNKSKGSNSYDIKINSKKEKTIVSHDKKGDPLIFELLISVKYEIIDNNKSIHKNTIEKKITYNNISDKFELTGYEKDIVDGFAKNIADEMILSISNLIK